MSFNKPNIMFTSSNPSQLDWDSLVFSQSGNHKTFSAGLESEEPTVYTSATKTVTQPSPFDLFDGMKIPLMVTTSPILIMEVRNVIISPGSLEIHILDNAHYDGSGTAELGYGDIHHEVDSLTLGNIMNPHPNVRRIPANRFIWAEVQGYQGGCDQVITTLEYQLDIQ